MLECFIVSFCVFKQKAVKWTSRPKQVTKKIEAAEKHLFLNHHPKNLTNNQTERQYTSPNILLV